MPEAREPEADAGELAAAAIVPYDEPLTFAAPAIVADTHADAAERFLEFFAATIRNRNTRMAYVRAVDGFLRWRGVAELGSLNEIRPLHVAAYIEECQARVSAPTVKQRLAALRACFDWMVRSGVMSSNPAHAVRGPAYSAVRGKTPVLAPSEARQLLESIPADDVVGLRDRALIALMTYSFAGTKTYGVKNRGPLHARTDTGRYIQSSPNEVYAKSFNWLPENPRPFSR